MMDYSPSIHVHDIRMDISWGVMICEFVMKVVNKAICNAACVDYIARHALIPRGLCGGMYGNWQWSDSRANKTAIDTM